MVWKFSRLRFNFVNLIDTYLRYVVSIQGGKYQQNAKQKNMF